MEEIEKMVSNAEHAAVITKRRDAMQDLGGSMKKIASYVKRNEGGPADVITAAMRIEAIAKTIPGLFPRKPEWRPIPMSPARNPKFIRIPPVSRLCL